MEIGYSHKYYADLDGETCEKFAEIEERLSFKDEGFEFELKGLKKKRERERDEKLLPRSLRPYYYSVLKFGAPNG